MFKHREFGILNRRPPLHWCSELRFLSENQNFSASKSFSRPVTTTKSIKTLNFFKKYERLLRKKDAPVPQSYDDRYVSSHSERNDDKIEIKYEPIWPNKNGKKIVSPTDEPHGLIALASFPGSGNTWLRYLLQQSTGILTGSVYKDYGLMKSGFPAESISNSSVLVVKTHEVSRLAYTRCLLCGFQ